MTGGPALTFDYSLLIRAAPTRVLAAFFDPVALAAWWQTVRSVTTPRPLGIYALEWPPTAFKDDMLGPLGGVFFGTVIEFRAGREFAVADAYWLPPEGEPIGPMALEVTCEPAGPATRLRVVQRGPEASERWRRYYSVITPGWQTSLRWLKTFLERGPEALRAAREAGSASGAGEESR
jgi:hypothetical protein